MGLIKKNLFLILILCFLIIPFYTQAEAACPKSLSIQECVKWGLEQTSAEAGYTFNENLDSQSISETVGNIISNILTFLGALVLIMIITAGFQWLTAQGDEEKLNTAKSRLKNALIVLLIIVAAFAITTFVTSNLKNIIDDATIPDNPANYICSNYDYDVCIDNVDRACGYWIPDQGCYPNPFDCDLRYPSDCEIPDPDTGHDVCLGEGGNCIITPQGDSCYCN